MWLQNSTYVVATAAVVVEVLKTVEVEVVYVESGPIGRPRFCSVTSFVRLSWTTRLRCSFKLPDDVHPES
jgi:hypothetical protein